MCLRTDTLLKVMEQLANPGDLLFLSFTSKTPLLWDKSFAINLKKKPDFSGVRRLVIVEAGSNRVEGIISLSDIFRFLLG